MRAAGHDYPDFVIPLAHAVARGKVKRGVAICGSGAGASVSGNKPRSLENRSRRHSHQGRDIPFRA